MPETRLGDVSVDEWSPELGVQEVDGNAHLWRSEDTGERERVGGATWTVKDSSV